MKTETISKITFLIKKNFLGELFGLSTIIVLLVTLSISIILYMQFDPTFNILTHYVSQLGSVPKGNPSGITYPSATVFNIGMLLAVPLRIGFLISLVLFMKNFGANKILSIFSFATGLISSAGWLLLGLVPFSSNLQLHLISAVVYFLGATSFQFIFALTEFKTHRLPKYLPLIGLLNLATFSVFSYFLIQVEVRQVPGMPEQPILEWLVYAVAIIWVIAHVLYMRQRRIKE
jgi:hypothetical protein